ncbi:MAG: right-handed parallel beta-helix repeat-containing protein, partial [Flavobacteriaceae bacterium]
MKKFLLITAMVFLAACQKSEDFIPEPVAESVFVPLQAKLNTAKYTSADADFFVQTAAQLVSSLNSAQSGDIVFIDSSAELKIETQIFIPEGVILASDRNNGTSLGAKIYRELKAINDWIVVQGDDVEISGLRIEGPHTEVADTNNITGIKIEGFINFEVNNCEISGFTSAGVHLKNASGYIHNNNFHHNRMLRLGYGVLLDSVSDALIEHNQFDYNLHDISGSGHCLQSYEARYNLVGANGTDHSFDMHSEDEDNVISGPNCAG